MRCRSSGVRGLPYPAMATRYFLFIILGAFVLGVSSCDQKSSSALLVKEGAQFPVLQVVTVKGEPVSTAQFAGKVLVVNLWATWCPPCRKELPSLDRLSRTLGPDNFAVMGISVDSDDYLLREFLIDRKVSFINFQDHEMKMTRDVLGVRAFPSTFIVRPDGRVYKIVEGARAWDSSEWVAEIRQLADR